MAEIYFIRVPVNMIGNWNLKQSTLNEKLVNKQKRPSEWFQWADKYELVDVSMSTYALLEQHFNVDVCKIYITVHFCELRTT